jgi:hypothetical protein
MLITFQNLAKHFEISFLSRSILRHRPMYVFHEEGTKPHHIPSTTHLIDDDFGDVQILEPILISNFGNVRPFIVRMVGRPYSFGLIDTVTFDIQFILEWSC